jgi:hypothetical protein
MRKLNSSAPIIIAIAILQGPLFYVGSYFALGRPEDSKWEIAARKDVGVNYHGYHNGGNWAWRMYWPLEQIDRRVRLEAWKEEPYLDEFRSGGVPVLPARP